MQSFVLVIQNVRKLKKVRKLADQFEERLEKIDDAIDQVRQRLRVVKPRNIKNRKSLKRSLKTLRKIQPELFVKFIEYGKAALKANEAKKELLEALKTAGTLISGIGQSVVAEKVFQKASSLPLLERDDKELQDIIANEISNKTLKSKIGSITTLDEKIETAKDLFMDSLIKDKKNAQDIFMKSEATSIGNPVLLYLKWLGLLVVLGVTIIGIKLVVRKQKDEIPLNEMFPILSSSIFSAFEETLIAVKVPETVAGEITEQFIKIARKTVSGLVGTVLKNHYKDSN